MIDVETIQLKHGGHKNRDDGVCLLEAVAWFAGEGHGDHPACCCPVLAAYGRRLNDSLRDDERQLLRPLIPRLAGSLVGPDVERRRAFLLADRAVRVIVPLGIEKRWPEQAAKLRSIPEVTDRASAKHATDVARAVRKEIAADAAAAAYAYAAYASAASAAAAAADAAATYAYAADDAAYAADDAAAAAYAYAADDARKQITAERIRSLELALEIR